MINGGVFGMNKNKTKIQFHFLLDVLNNSVNYMFRAIDENNVNDFTLWFTMWQNARKQIILNPYNDCGHKLCDEILEYANKNNITQIY